MNKMRAGLNALLCLIPLLVSGLCTAEDYLSQEEFLHGVFAGQTPVTHKHWLTEEDKNNAERILGHPYSALRVRYWAQGTKSAWTFDEIGKVKPISIGIVIEQQKIAEVKILAFRESRGWEVKHDFFTDQFAGAALTDDMALDESIDGITGATLSVRAVTKTARLALYFAQTLTPNMQTYVESDKKD